MRHWHLLLGPLQLVIRIPWIWCTLFALYYLQDYERVSTEIGVACGIRFINIVVYCCLGLLARFVDPRWKRYLAKCRIRQFLQEGLIDEALFLEMTRDMDRSVGFVFRRIDEPVPDMFPNGDEDEEWLYHVFLQILCILLIVAYLQLSHIVAQQFAVAQ